jgi:hypothetical protein
VISWGVLISKVRFVGRGGAGMYYSDFGPLKGPLREPDVPSSMAILRTPGSHMLLGQADPLGPDADGNTEFRLEVGGRLLQGRWLLVGRKFVRAQDRV